MSGNNKNFAPLPNKHIQQHLHHQPQEPQQRHLQQLATSLMPGGDVQGAVEDDPMIIMIIIEYQEFVSNRMFRRSYTNVQLVLQDAPCTIRRTPTATPRTRNAAILSER